MPRAFGNCAYSYRNNRGKPVFAPSPEGRRIGKELKAKLEAIYEPEPFFYHLRDGGHVGALHAHRVKRYFARLDIENFFYTVGRNRVARVLRDLSVDRHEFYARWSSVKNPYGQPSYALPYGFVQSPLLASIVLSRSAVGQVLRELSEKVLVSVYVDDIAISGNNRRVLERSYNKLRRMLHASGFIVNENKSCTVTNQLGLFNCDLAHKRDEVTDARIEEFYAEERPARSQASFEAYCEAVKSGNET
jgi:hypothetical protein